MPNFIDSEQMLKDFEIMKYFADEETLNKITKYIEDKTITGETINKWNIDWENQTTSCPLCSWSINMIFGDSDCGMYRFCPKCGSDMALYNPYDCDAWNQKCKYFENDGYSKCMGQKGMPQVNCNGIKKNCEL